MNRNWVGKAACSGLDPAVFYPPTDEDADEAKAICAAMTEADYLPGDERIEFALAGSAPVTIPLSRRRPIIASRTGSAGA